MEKPMRISLVCAAVLICVWISVLSGAMHGSVPAANASGEERTGRADDVREPAVDKGLAGSMPAVPDRETHKEESVEEDVASRMARLEEERVRISESLLMLKKDAGRNLEEARAAVVALYKYKQMRYFTFLLSANGLNQAMESEYWTNRFLREDYRVLADLRARVLNLNALETHLARKERELSEVKIEAAAYNAAMTTSNGKRKSGDAVGLLEQAAVAPQPEEIRRKSEQRAITRKPILVFGEIPFSARRGGLFLPTPGEIVATYGTRPNANVQSILYNNGILITARSGCPVQAVHEGLVMFADELKDYGNVVIINHGEHYYSLIAHVGEITRKTGESVKAGETIATMGDTSSRGAPKLYFEIRHHGKPVNPMEWLAVQKSSKE